MSECAGCDVCGRCDENALYGDVDGKHYCSGCWKKAGKPFPRRIRTTQEIHEAEVSARDRMMMRGGADRYRVRSGKA